MAKKKPENLSFEESMSELETIVNALEQGDLPLEDSMKLFERGLALSQHSQKTLASAEQKIQILMNRDEQAPLQPFADPESDS
ncbi:exodeoxyribonuclease VII small subunit [Thalassotalea mangrovi]|uniref:Exodeoxyribonuclease 7 small subunit n=1 Tax=Thalassotalea mangrovi TaxID=2572245 RepID=A0A4U1B4S0_9GAMM|nr:exodeoxyribonuclease VII small subunit [Thalassotalea mangrovi]TKB44499.1 exodeoxyribonuclease VII small subunit [Thalassotalea mangrovi]